MIKWIADNTGLFLIASLTLGLAPFLPEPHLWGKLRWILGGAKGMQLMDYFDLVMHGFPWLLLIISIGLKITYKNKLNQ